MLKVLRNARLTCSCFFITLAVSARFVQLERYVYERFVVTVTTTSKLEKDTEQKVTE